MPIVTRHSLITVAVLALACLLAVGIFVWSGIYNIGADDAHTKPVYSVLQTLRERSIIARADELQPPDLKDPARIRQGAGNYNAMCTGCHLGPGMAATELSNGLYPSPPNLSKADVGSPAHHFWVIKHGIKASGMPAWGKSMNDEYIWNMVAFLQELPKLDAEQYQTMVASSGGHSHGGGETEPHGHAEGASAGNDEDAVDDHGQMEGMPMNGESKPHSHAPGSPSRDDGGSASMKKVDMPKNEPKPHSHAPGTPPHDDKAPAAAKPADEHAGMAMPKAETEEHADDGHQH